MTAAAAGAVPQPVAAPISADPTGPARGTMLMIHAGGWAGHDAYAQQLLMERPGTQLVRRGWRVVSLDYEEGVAGLQNLVDAAAGELVRGTGNGPLCLYGESAGAHLALVAAARLLAINCVIGLGAPIDLMLYRAETGGDRLREIVALQISKFFGTTKAATAPWDIVALAPSIHADVLLLHEADDTVVSANQAQRLLTVRPLTQLVELEAGDPAIASDHFLHGTVSPAGRALYAAQVDAFADRAIAARHAERSAVRTGCAGIERSLSDVSSGGFRAALRCLARHDRSSLATGVGAWRRTAVDLPGQANAARVWAALRATSSGRHALAAAARRRVRVSLLTGATTRVVLRAARSRV